MWLLTCHGFFSVVRKSDGRFHVRGRERDDLENLLNGVPLPGTPIHESSSADYPVRLIVDAEALSRIFRFLEASIDYDNFKGCIDRSPGQARKREAYHKIWQVLADALGAYGKPGRAPKSRTSR